jgi:hypothetical protein
MPISRSVAAGTREAILGDLAEVVVEGVEVRSHPAEMTNDQTRMTNE